VYYCTGQLYWLATSIDALLAAPAPTAFALLLHGHCGIRIAAPEPLLCLHTCTVGVARSSFVISTLALHQALESSVVLSPRHLPLEIGVGIGIKVPHTLATCFGFIASAADAGVGICATARLHSCTGGTSTLPHRHSPAAFGTGFATLPAL
jgi:hypothetical protein